MEKTKIREELLATPLKQVTSFLALAIGLPSLVEDTCLVQRVNEESVSR